MSSDNLEKFSNDIAFRIGTDFRKSCIGIGMSFEAMQTTFETLVALIAIGLTASANPPDKIKFATELLTWIDNRAHDRIVQFFKNHPTK